DGSTIQVQRTILLFGQIQQALARSLLVLVARNQNRRLLLTRQPFGIPDAWAAGQHPRTAENTGRWSGQDALAFALIAYKRDIASCEGKIALADLALQRWWQRFGQKQIRIADAPDQTIHVNRKIGDLPLLLSRLENQQNLLAASQTEARDQRMPAA